MLCKSDLEDHDALATEGQLLNQHARYASEPSLMHSNFAHSDLLPLSFSLKTHLVPCPFAPHTTTKIAESPWSHDMPATRLDGDLH